MADLTRDELNARLDDLKDLLQEGFREVHRRIDRMDDRLNGRIRRLETTVPVIESRVTDVVEQRRQGAVTGARVGGAITAAAAVTIELVRRLWAG